MAPLAPKFAETAFSAKRFPSKYPRSGGSLSRGPKSAAEIYEKRFAPADAAVLAMFALAWPLISSMVEWEPKAPTVEMTASAPSSARESELASWASAVSHSAPGRLCATSEGGAPVRLTEATRRPCANALRMIRVPM